MSFDHEQISKLPHNFFRHILLHEYFSMKNAGSINATQAATNIIKIYGEGPSIRTAEVWFARFNEGNYDIEDRPRSDRPSKLNSDELEALRLSDPNMTEAEIGELLGVDHSTVSRHFTKAGVRYRYGREVPHYLTPDNQMSRFTICLNFYSRHRNKKTFLRKIVTGDDTWIFYANIKKTRQHLKPGESGSLRLKPNPHRKKLMLLVFWDMKGVIHWKLLDKKQKLNSKFYTEELETLAEKMSILRPEKEKVLLLHDNATPHVSQLTKGAIEKLGWEVMAHPSNSPDLAPSDYALFRSLKDALNKQEFENSEEIKKWLDNFFRVKDSERFYANAIRDLPRRWSLVVEHNGNYFDDEE